MTKKTDKSRNPSTADLKPQSLDVSARQGEDILKVLQDLHTHQIELEMQNEELRHSHAALEQSRSSYRDLYDFAPIAYLTLSRKWVILQANLAAARLLGKDRNALLEQPLPAFIFSEDQDCFYKYRKNITQGGTRNACELRLVKSGSSRFSVHLDSVLIFDSETKTEQYFVAITDLTDTRRAAVEKENLTKSLDSAQHQIEREKLQNKVLGQSKFASLGQLASGVAHEINQPLTYIKIMLEVLLRDLTKKRVDLDELENDCQDAITQIFRITKIIDHLRVFGRSDGTQFEDVHIENVVADTLILVGQQLKMKNITFCYHIDDNLPNFWGSALKLEQVLINLFQNSIDALEGQKEKSISLDICLVNGVIKITFVDSGEGIPADFQEKIFEPFFTTKDPGKGMGIGLSLVHSIIAEHRGSISIVPSPEGAIFLICIPVVN